MLKLLVIKKGEIIMEKITIDKKEFLLLLSTMELLMESQTDTVKHLIQENVETYKKHFKSVELGEMK